MTVIFHDMLRCCLEDFVDMVVRFKEDRNYVNDLRQVFERCGCNKLKINPLKCALVYLFEILRFSVHKNEFDFDPTKAKAIQTIEPPSTCSELKSFM